MTTVDLIRGETFHGRKGAVANSFRYTVDYVLLDPDQTKGPWLFSRNRASLTAVHDRDYGGPVGQGRGTAWVRQVLAEHPRHGRNADDLAAWLNLSPRTLHRQLREEGASLQALKDSVRQQRARELLLRTARPLKQIAAEVGFGSEKSFIRAFRTWTGSTPEAFRHGAMDR